MIFPLGGSSLHRRETPELPISGDRIQGPGPSGTRSWLVLALLLLITIINFIDRQTLSVLAPVLRSTFHLTNEYYGRIVAALQFGMMSCELPMGWLMDQWGPQVGLGFAVLLWSTATGSQIFARSGFQLGIARFWIGAGECGNFSGGMKTVAHLFSKKDRTLAIGIFNSGTTIGATVAPPLIVYLMQQYGFRVAFLAPALLGFLWMPLWWMATGRNYLHRQLDAEAHGSTVALLRKSSAWAVMLCRFFIGPVMQFYWYWIPSYLFSARHMTMTQIGMLAWIPFIFGDTGGIAGGWVARYLHSRGISTRNVRRIIMYSSSSVCATSLLVPYMHTAKTTLLVIGLAILANSFLAVNMFGAVTDLFPDDEVGRATGLTGVAGGFSGLLFPVLTGILVDHISYKPVFLLVGLMPLVGTIALFLVGHDYRIKTSLNSPRQ